MAFNFSAGGIEAVRGPQLAREFGKSIVHFVGNFPLNYSVWKRARLQTSSLLITVAGAMDDSPIKKRLVSKTYRDRLKNGA